LRETILEIEKLKLKIHSFTCPRLHSDLARALCEQTVAESDKAALGGMKAADWCAIQANIDPFIRALTVAKEQAAQKTGLKREAWCFLLHKRN